MWPIARLSTVTEASDTRWTTALMRVRLKPDTTEGSRLQSDLTGSVRLQPALSGSVRLQRDLTSTVRLQPDPQLRRRIQPRIEQMSRRDVAEGLQHRLLHARMFALQLRQQPFRP